MQKSSQLGEMRGARMPDIVIVPEVTWQHDSELLAMCEFMLQRGSINTVVEIGTYRGGTAFVWSQIAKRVICVDKDFVQDGIQPYYRGRGLPIFEVQGDSLFPQTMGRVKEILNGDKIDLLYIDGDHYYGPTSKDLQYYSSLVKQGGWVAFHDIVNTATQTPWLWKELVDKYPTYEFVCQRQPVDKKFTHLNLDMMLGLGLIYWTEKNNE